MSCLMLAATLALGIDPQPTPPPARPAIAPTQQGQTQQGQTMASHLDGTWIVMFAEKDGQKLNNSQNDTVTIHGNVLTWQKEGKEHHLHLQFGANHQLTGWPDTHVARRQDSG